MKEERVRQFSKQFISPFSRVLSRNRYEFEIAEPDGPK